MRTYPTEGSILSAILRRHQAFLNYETQKKTLPAGSQRERQIPSIETIKRLYNIEEYNQFGVAMEDRRISGELESLRNDPIITLLKCLTWNESVTCVPLHKLKEGFVDFYQLYSCEVSKLNIKNLKYMYILTNFI